MPKEIKPDQNGKKPLINFVQAGVGTIFSSMLLSGLLIGYTVDRWLETAPLAILFFSLLGFIGGLIKVSELTKKQDETKNEK